MLSKLLRSKIRNYRDDGYNLINCNFAATNSLFCDEWFSDLGYLWVAQARDLALSGMGSESKKNAHL